VDVDSTSDYDWNLSDAPSASDSQSDDSFTSPPKTIRRNRLKYTDATEDVGKGIQQCLTHVSIVNTLWKDPNQGEFSDYIQILILITNVFHLLFQDVKDESTRTALMIQLKAAEKALTAIIRKVQTGASGSHASSAGDSEAIIRKFCRKFFEHGVNIPYDADVFYFGKYYLFLNLFLCL
jgi:hypothetical protein